MSSSTQLPEPLALAARGRSMHPFVPDGTLMLFEPSLGIRVGDVILAASGERWLAHRVVHVDGNSVITWGDWNRGADPAWRHDEVVGRCTVMLRKGTPVSMDWPLMRFVNLSLARTLPPLKRVLGALLRP